MDIEKETAMEMKGVIIVPNVSSEFLVFKLKGRLYVRANNNYDEDRRDIVKKFVHEAGASQLENSGKYIEIETEGELHYAGSCLGGGRISFAENRRISVVCNYGEFGKKYADRRFLKKILQRKFPRHAITVTTWTPFYFSSDYCAGTISDKEEWEYMLKRSLSQTTCVEKEEMLALMLDTVCVGISTADWHERWNVSLRHRWFLASVWFPE